MGELLAVYPPTGGRIHLYLEGFQPGKKRRDSQYESALCAATVTLRSGIGFAHERATGRVHVPFAEAVRLETVRPPLPEDPRPIHADWSWCPVCIGWAVREFGLTLGVLATLAEAVQ